MRKLFVATLVTAIALCGLTVPAGASTAEISARFAGGYLVLMVGSVKHECPAHENERRNPFDGSAVIISGTCKNGTAFTYAAPAVYYGVPSPASFKVRVGWKVAYICDGPIVGTVYPPRFACPGTTQGTGL